MISYPNPKINLGLDVLRRREDGYHDLESLFVPYFGTKDVLEIEEAGKFSIDIKMFDAGGVAVPVTWNPMEDLCVKAYKLLAKDFTLPPVSIRLEKHIPVGAGLGGGSADCAFALRMLSEMFDLYIPDVMLEIYAATLGSDCPFFVYNTPMFVSGRGDELEEFTLPALEDYRIEVKLPVGVSVSTAEAYRGIVPTAPSTPLREALTLPIEQWKDVVKNDFEKTVFALHPEIEALKRDFYSAGAVYASMSGSGSAVFGIFRKLRESLA